VPDDTPQRSPLEEPQAQESAPLCDDDPNSDKHDWVLTEAAAWTNYYQCTKCGATSKADSGV
jgi:hypothetical protein